MGKTWFEDIGQKDQQAGAEGVEHAICGRGAADQEAKEVADGHKGTGPSSAFFAHLLGTSKVETKLGIKRDGTKGEVVDDSTPWALQLDSDLRSMACFEAGAHWLEWWDGSLINAAKMSK